MDVTKEADGLPNVSVTQTWPANDLGNHVLLLKAINRDGAASDPTTINISVVPQSTIGLPTPGATRAGQPTLVSVATPVPATNTPAPPTATSAPSACDPDATFVADVTVPDNSIFKPGDPISKVWRVRNGGACPWDAGTVLAFVEGAQMGANNTVPVPLAAQGTTVDLAVTMSAPKSSGTYTGKWRLRSGAGKLFGQSVSIVIKVVDTTPPTATPAVPVATATSAALAASFSVNHDVIAYGDCVTFKWDVDNAISVKFDDKGAVGHDTRQVCPTETKDYDLQAFPAAGDPVVKELTVTVNKPASFGHAGAGRQLRRPGPGQTVGGAGWCGFPLGRSAYANTEGYGYFRACGHAPLYRCSAGRMLKRYRVQQCCAQRRIGWGRARSSATRPMAANPESCASSAPTATWCSSE